MNNPFSAWAAGTKAPPSQDQLRVSRKLRWVASLIGIPINCRYCSTLIVFGSCGAPVPHNTATVDHVLPQGMGGKWVAANMVWSCWACNDARNRIHTANHRDKRGVLDAYVALTASRGLTLMSSFMLHIGPFGPPSRPVGGENPQHES